jgi:glycine cleavage system H lipoate-binding protein
VLGTALCTLSFEQDWVRRRKDTRAVLITAYGRRKLQDLLDVRLET